MFIFSQCGRYIWRNLDGENFEPYVKNEVRKLLAQVTMPGSTKPPEKSEIKKPSIVSRKEWSARPLKEGADVLEYTGDLKKILTHIVVHETAFADRPGPRHIQDYQMDRMGYDDMAYHFFIDKDGKIYEGRDIHLMGSHAGQTKEANELAKAIRAGTVTDRTIPQARAMDPDFGTIGVVLDGRFDNSVQVPSPQQLIALKSLLKYLKQEYEIPGENIITHDHVKPDIVERRGLTFLEGTETECPGLPVSQALAAMKPDFSPDSPAAVQKKLPQTLPPSHE
ncbi:MAG: peptidoglycan recognition family protein [Patescibacteria group bacterium]